MTRFRAAAFAAVVVFAAGAAQAQTTTNPAEVHAGTYRLDPSHSKATWSVTHFGFSTYVGQFATVNGVLVLDPKAPAASKLDVTVDTTSLGTLNPALDTHLKSADFLDVAKYPQALFHATRIVVTGPKTAAITGDLTLHGVTKPVVLDVTYNGGYAGHPMDPHARVGFSAKGSFKRSDFGIAYGVPAPGTTMGVSDEVQVTIEAEFSGPPLATAPAAASGH